MPLSVNNEKESCRTHHKNGLSSNERCSIWNFRSQETQGLRCPVNGFINGICNGDGAATCYSQNDYLKMAANCTGIDSSYITGGQVDADTRGHCPAGTALVNVTAPGGWLSKGKGQCQKLVANAFDNDDGVTTNNTGPNWANPSWTNGPVRVTQGTKLQFCPSNHVATIYYNGGNNLGCKKLRPLQNDFIETFSTDHT